MERFREDTVEVLKELQSFYTEEEGKIFTKSYIGKFNKIKYSFPKDYTYIDRIKKIIENILNNDSIVKGDFTEFINNIYSFANFILFADVAFFFENDDSNNIYAEQINNATVIYFKEDLFKVKITFEKTTVPIPKESVLDDDKFATFVNIDIAREYGKHITNKCQYVIGEPITKENLTYESCVLFTIVANKINKIIADTYKSILQKTIINYLNIQTIDIDELLYDGLYRLKRK